MQRMFRDILCAKGSYSSGRVYKIQGKDINQNFAATILLAPDASSLVLMVINPLQRPLESCPKYLIMAKNGPI